jgi:probable HAF family extracellular repeat protein
MVTIAIPDYEVTYLGTVPGYVGSRGTALNDGGQVVGAVYEIMAGTRPARPFIYSGGKMSLMLPPRTGGTAYGINASAQAVGQSGTAFLWSSTSLVNLGTLGGTTSAAQGINASGQVVGWSTTAEPGTTRAFSYTNGNMTDLGTLGGRSSWAYADDDTGRVVGAAETAAGQRHAFLLSGGTMTDLGTLKGGTSTAYAIGASGAVVGMSDDHAFRFANGTMEDLGALGGNWSASYGVDGSGDVVGAAESSAWSWNSASPWVFGPDRHAFVFKFGAMYDLNEHLAQPIGWHITEARAINASGQILANLCSTWLIAGGTPWEECGALLLTPLKEVVPRQ